MNPNVLPQSTGVNILIPSVTHITDDFRIGSQVLGLGISGKVVECYCIKTGQKFALKVYSILLLPSLTSLDSRNLFVDFTGQCQSQEGSGASLEGQQSHTHC